MTSACRDILDEEDWYSIGGKTLQDDKYYNNYCKSPMMEIKRHAEEYL